MGKKKVVVALGHRALGTTLPEQKCATKSSAKILADLIECGLNLVITCLLYTSAQTSPA